MSMTLGNDASVGGNYVPQPLPKIADHVELGQYTVSLEGAMFPGQASNLTLSVSKDGQPVTDLEPYLAAEGHLVALRVGDLGYLHVHPEGETGDGKAAASPEIVFMAAAPSPGLYSLFLDFRHEGVVRTAEFTMHAQVQPQTSEHTEHGHHGHH